MAAGVGGKAVPQDLIGPFGDFGGRQAVAEQRECLAELCCCRCDHAVESLLVRCGGDLLTSRVSGTIVGRGLDLAEVQPEFDSGC